MFRGKLFSATRILSSKTSTFIFAIAFGVALTSSFGSSAQAATITVNGLGDTLGNNGVCTVREAIINANNNAATWPDCAAGSGADVINLPAGLS
jgi:CSLREA domain-containing protein